MSSEKPAQRALRCFLLILLGQYFGVSCAPIAADIYVRMLSESGTSPWWQVGVVQLDLGEGNTSSEVQQETVLNSASPLKWVSYDPSNLNAALHATGPPNGKDSSTLLSVKVQQRGHSSSVIASAPVEEVHTPHYTPGNVEKRGTLQCEGKDIPWTLEVRLGKSGDHEPQSKEEQRVVGAAIYSGSASTAFEKSLVGGRVKGRVSCVNHQPGIVLLTLPSASANSAASVLLPDSARPRDQEEQGSQQRKEKEQQQQPSLLQRYWWFIPLTAAVHLVLSGGFGETSSAVEGEERRTSRAPASPASTHRAVGGGNRRRN